MFGEYNKIGRQVLKRYGAKCWYCGIPLNRKNKTVDHYIPRSYGGSNKIENLRPCCRTCNTIKSNVDMETFRLRMRIKKAEMPKFMNSTVLLYLEKEHDFVIELPEYEFYFEALP